MTHVRKPSSTAVRPLNPANRVLYPIGGYHVVEVLHDLGRNGLIRVRVLDAAEFEDECYAPGMVLTVPRVHYADVPTDQPTATCTCDHCSTQATS